MYGNVFPSKLHLSLIIRQTHSGGSLGAGIRRAWDAEGLLRLRLVGSLLALQALVERAVQVSSGFADRKRALLYRRGSHIRGRSAERARLA